MKISLHKSFAVCSRVANGLLLIAAATSVFNFAQTPEPPNSLGLENGLASFDTPDFILKLVTSSQTAAALMPKGGAGYDVLPSDWLEKRAKDGFYHLGDLRFSVREAGTGAWRQFSTAEARASVVELPPSAPVLAAADLSPTFRGVSPLQVIRKWTLDAGRLVLTFELRNITDKPIEIGDLSMPMPFNNILTDRSLPEAHEKCSFSDPYIGLDAGFIQVTRLNGKGPAIVVVPQGKTPLEAYNLLAEPVRPQQTFEGMFEWMVHSQALAERDWIKVKVSNRPSGTSLFEWILFSKSIGSEPAFIADPWNPPTSETLPPNGKREIGVKFLASDKIQNIEKTLAENDRPVAVGIPGYVLPTDIDGKLFLKSKVPIRNVTVEPANSMTITQQRTSPNGWKALSVRGTGWGRARLTIDYSDGTRQTIQYYVTKPAKTIVSDLGRFLTTKQWYEKAADPFNRSPSVMGYDREEDRIVEQDNRVWIAGLGDEGGGGSWVAAAMKEFVQPDADEIAKYERFIDGVLWGGIQYKDGPNKYGVRKSLFHYSPQEFPSFAYDSSLNWSTWASWKKDQAMSISRGYNYPHVVAAYWAMYRTARNTEGLVKNHPWDWYLDQAFQTAQFLFSRDANGKRRVEYAELGLMEGTIFLELLKDLKREGWVHKSDDLERLMKERADVWKSEEYPFGSEMAWDSTGQEEVYAWCKYFGYTDKAMVSLNSIVGYMPGIPHWGYNGNARRYWDFLYAAKLRRIERQIHHYGSGLNAIPMLDYYRDHPDDEYMLRVGYAGGTAALTNVDQDGFASAAFHSYPDTLKWDAYSGDYGMNFFGHAMNAATYVINSRDFGWQTFGGNIVVNDPTHVEVEPRDSMRRRVYIAPFGLWLTLDAGNFTEIAINKRTHRVGIKFAPAGHNGELARLRIEQPAKIAGIGRFGPAGQFKVERDAYVIPLNKNVKQIFLSEMK